MAKLNFDKIDSAVDDFAANIGYLEKIKDICDKVDSASEKIKATPHNSRIKQ